MSIKTYKRIALGVIASLVFAPFAAIAPASAVEAVATDLEKLYVNGIGANYQLVQREDVAFSVSVGYDVDGDTSPAANETIALSAVFTSKPAASTVVALTATVQDAMDSTAGDTETAPAQQSGSVAKVDGTGLVAAKLTATPAAGKILIDDLNIGSFGFTPDVPGTYVARVWHDADEDGFADAGELSRTITVIAGGTPSAMAVTTYGSTSSVTNAGIADAQEVGSLIKISLSDVAGNATVLAAGEGLTLTGTGSVTLDGTADTITLTSSTSVDRSGDMKVNVKKAAAGSSTVTITPAGTIASAFAAKSTVLTFVAVSESDVADYVIDETTGVSATAFGAGNALTAVAASTGKTSITYEITSVADGTSRYVVAHIVDTTGSITGIPGAEYSQAVAIDDDAAGTASFTLTVASWSSTLRAASGAAGADSYQLFFGDDTVNNSEGVEVTATAATNSAANSAWNVSSISAVAGASISVTLTVEDQFGLTRSGQAVVFAIAGRNSTITAGLNAVTDANGKATFTYTDAGTATSATTDTISATAGGTLVTATVSVSFDAGNAVSTVVLTGGDTTAGVTNAVVSVKDIGAGATGAQAVTHTFSATVKNAAGTVLAGVPVTWSISGDTAAVLSTAASTYTNASGVASTSVYAWKSGQYTVTATAGTASGTGLITFAQTTATEARKISATVAGSTVTAKVVDRFGNGVNGVNVYAKRTSGNGYFGSGVLSTSSATDANGEVSFVVAGADAGITVSTVDFTAPAGTTYGQTCAAAGKANCAATPTAFTAYVAGTATTAETGVGASFADAGVASAVVNVTGLTPAEPVATPDKPTLTAVKSGGRVYLSGTAMDGEGDIIIYVKRVGTSAWKERAKTLEVAAPGDFNGSIRAPKNNVVIRVKQEGTGLFSNQVLVLK